MTFRVGQVFVVDVELDTPLCPLDTRCTPPLGQPMSLDFSKFLQVYGGWGGDNKVRSG